MSLKDQMVQLASRGVHQRRKPRDIEHNIQCSCVQWYRKTYPNNIHNLFAVPNGGKRDRTTAGKLKGEGVLAGVSDLILLKSTPNHGALLIEMKSRTGQQEDEQRQWQRLIERDGYKYVICRSLEDFQREVTQYLASSESN